VNSAILKFLAMIFLSGLYEGMIKQPRPKAQAPPPNDLAPFIKRQSQPANSISNPSIACGRRFGVGFWWRDTCDSNQRIILKYGIPSLCQIPMTTLSVFSSLVQQSKN
jgi:hypothetical protein